MSDPLRVILVSPSAHYPAHNWTDTLQLMRALRNKGEDVHTIIFSTTTEPVPSDLAGSVESVFSCTPGLLKRSASGKWQDRRFGRLISVLETAACLIKAMFRSKRGNTEAVLHFIGGSYWVVMLAAVLSRRLRFVVSVYGEILVGEPKGFKAIIRRALKKLVKSAAATNRLDLVCENELLREQIAPFLGARIHVIPYAIDDSEKLRSLPEARQRLALPMAEKIVLFFGTHRREKDYDTSLKGCLTLADPPLALFVGKVISSNDPREVIARSNYPKSVVVDEFVPEEKAKDYFAAADVVALPYEADFSRGSGVLIECCRFMRPMIVSATPYFSPFVARYKCGVCYTAGDAASFAEAIKSVLANPEGFQAGLNQARRDHSWSTLIERYVELYQGRIP